MLDADGGTVIASERLLQVKHCLQVHATGDESRFYVAFSDTFADARNFRANGQRDQSRNPLVSGACARWIAVTGKRFGPARFSTPCLRSINRGWPRFWSFRTVNLDTARRRRENGLAWPILHCIDKRTGRDVFKERFGSVQPMTRSFAEAELGRREVIVRWPDASVRFRYSR